MGPWEQSGDAHSNSEDVESGQKILLIAVTGRTNVSHWIGWTQNYQLQRPNCVYIYNWFKPECNFSQQQQKGVWPLSKADIHVTIKWKLLDPFPRGAILLAFSVQT